MTHTRQDRTLEPWCHRSWAKCFFLFWALVLCDPDWLRGQHPTPVTSSASVTFELLGQAGAATDLADDTSWTIGGVPVFDDDLYKLGIRFLFNALFLALVFTIATKAGRLKREFAFPVIMMNLMAFFICFTMKKLDLGLGMALGLFAIFAVLRYRTQSIQVKEMTYLFIGIGIAVVNSLSNKKTSYLELLMVNSIVTCTALLIERYMARDRRSQHTATYDRLDLLAPGKRGDLLADLHMRTGLDITDAEIQRIDLRNDRATLLITTRVSSQHAPPLTPQPTRHQSASAHGQPGSGVAAANPGATGLPTHPLPNEQGGTDKEGDAPPPPAPRS